MTAPADFQHTERGLLASLGLAKKMVRDVRVAQLARGVDWQHLGNEVRYSDAGRAKLLAALHASPAPVAATTPPPDYSAPKNSPEPAATPLAAAVASTPEPAAEPGHAPAAEPVPPVGTLQRADVHELVVVRLFARNRRIILARYQDREDARVRVKDSRKLRAGMTLRCSYIEGDLWEIAQRLPRWPGRP